MDSPSSPSAGDRQPETLATLLQERFTHGQRLAILRALQIDPEDVQLLPETREDFSWRMVEHCQRCGRLDELWSKVDERLAHHPLPRRTIWMRRALVVAAVLLSLCGIAAAFLSRSTITQLPPGGGVVLVQSWVTSSQVQRAGAALCDELRRGDADRTDCMYRPLFGRSDADVVDAARNAGASIVVLVADDGRARLVPLGLLEGQDIFREDIPPIDLLPPAGTPRRLASIAHALSRMAASEKDFNPALVRCPEASPVSEKPIALLGLLVGMLAPQCAPPVPDPSVIDSICGQEGSEREGSWGCAVARLFYISQCPDCIQAEEMAKRLRKRGPGRFRIPLGGPATDQPELGGDGSR